ncbi:MAG TPA: M4 family metallopeptidase [Thermoanaerobaculia bacterium]|nr:M4 family metallopeptidase [Thermoanaerobaculia bacterium]
MPGKNGLRTFAFHRDESATSPAMAMALGAAPGGAVAGVAPGEDLGSMEPERAALLLLKNALGSASLPGFTAPEVDGGGAEFKSLGHRKLFLTNSQTVKFRELYRKIPIYGSLITVEMDTRNRLLSINSSLGEPAGVDPVAKVSPADALATIRKAAGHGEEALDAQPVLHYYFDDAGTWRLVYIVEDVPHREAPPAAPDDLGGPGDHLLPEVFDYVVDAHSGELVATLPRTQTAGAQAAPPAVLDDEAPDGLAVPRRFRCSDVPGTGRVLADPGANVLTYDFAFRSLDAERGGLPGAAVVRKEPDPWDPAAVSAHANAAEVADFLQRVLMRRGLDDAGGAFISTINCVRIPGGKEWRNAAWIGTQMVYGQRQVEGKLRSYAVARDVVAHEMFHGVTERTARLDYVGESGALNESYSDVFGILIANSHQPDVAQWDWKIGEELDGTGLPLRDVSAPERCGQPAHRKDYQDLPRTAAGDWGGVHKNSGIHNKAAYNLLTAERDGAPVLDPAAVAKLFYLTLTEQLSRTSVFADSRRGVELVARSLFRNDPARDGKLAAISKAFEDVGIEAG